jgi:hypothetical protein
MSPLTHPEAVNPLVVAHLLSSRERPGTRRPIAA